MCGIVGYVGEREALPFLTEGLRRLEYRGYDSAGVAVLGPSLRIVRASGKIAALADRLRTEEPNGTTGIAHTRWATHGPPSEANAHPHADCRHRAAIVHNGIIENYGELKGELAARGHRFASETDSEVLAHLLEEGLQAGKSLADALASALNRVRGTYGVVAISEDHPGRLAAARLGSPLVVGIGRDEYFVASDAAAILGHASGVVHLKDGELVEASAEGYVVRSLVSAPVDGTVERLEGTVAGLQKNGHPHFMLKEIHEQPDVLRNVLRGRVDMEAGTSILGGLRDVGDRLASLDRLSIVACGSAYYAGLIGKRMIEEWAGIPVEVDVASEYRYRDPIVTAHTAVCAVSQSGETADTLAALREAKRKGALTIGLVNVVGSAVARETDAGIFTHAGPEISVASTKAFLAQVATLALLAVHLGRRRGLPSASARAILSELERLPRLIASVLEQAAAFRTLAREYGAERDFFYLGRGYGLPLALEGALKLKEIAYVHAEGYGAGELKHGPISLVDAAFPSLVIAPRDSVYEKTRSAIEQIRARGGRVLALTDEGNADLDGLAAQVIRVPHVSEALFPLVGIVPLQLFAYYSAVQRGLDPDQPRNLAKSVTVE